MELDGSRGGMERALLPLEGNGAVVREKQGFACATLDEAMIAFPLGLILFCLGAGAGPSYCAAHEKKSAFCFDHHRHYHRRNRGSGRS